MLLFLATALQSNKTVAVKKIRFGKDTEGVNVTALREIKLLKELRHPNVIEMVDVFPHKQNLNLVFEFMSTDLEVCDSLCSPHWRPWFLPLTLFVFICA